MIANIKDQREKILRLRITQDRKDGERLATLRKSKGLKASWVAGQLGVTPAYISDLEHGRRHWQFHVIQAYLKAIGEK